MNRSMNIFCWPFFLALLICSPFADAADSLIHEDPSVTAKKIAEAVKSANKGKPQGFEGLLEIADNNEKIAVDQSESAYESLMLLLHANPKKWIDALSQAQFERAKRLVSQLGIPDSPAGYRGKMNFRTEVFEKVRSLHPRTANARALKQILLDQEKK